MKKELKIKNQKIRKILPLFLGIIAAMFFLFFSTRFIKKTIMGAEYYRVNANQEMTINECSKCSSDPKCCQRVKNECSYDIFVPTNTCTEWSELKINRPACVMLNDCTYTLSVNSSGASSVTITSTSGHGGTTNYTRSVVGGTSVNLTAPSSVGGATFSSWSGCYSSVNQTINFTMPHENTTCTVNYTTSGGGGGGGEDPCANITCGSCHGCSSIDNSACCGYYGQTCYYGWIVDLYRCVIDYCSPFTGKCLKETTICTCSTGVKC